MCCCLESAKLSVSFAENMYVSWVAVAVFKISKYTLMISYYTVDSCWMMQYFQMNNKKSNTENQKSDVSFIKNKETIVFPCFFLVFLWIFAILCLSLFFNMFLWFFLWFLQGKDFQKYPPNKKWHFSVRESWHSLDFWPGFQSGVWPGVLGRGRRMNAVYSSIGP